MLQRQGRGGDCAACKGSSQVLQLHSKGNCLETATALTLQVHCAGDAHKSGHSDMETVAFELVPWSGRVHL